MTAIKTLTMKWDLHLSTQSGIIWEVEYNLSYSLDNQVSYIKTPFLMIAKESALQKKKVDNTYKPVSLINL